MCGVQTAGEFEPILITCSQYAWVLGLGIHCMRHITLGGQLERQDEGR